MTGSIILPLPGHVMLKLANPVGKCSKPPFLYGKKPEWSPFRLLLANGGAPLFQRTHHHPFNKIPLHKRIDAQHGKRRHHNRGVFDGFPDLVPVGGAHTC